MIIISNRHEYVNGNKKNCVRLLNAIFLTENSKYTQIQINVSVFNPVKRIYKISIVFNVNSNEDF